MFSDFSKKLTEFWKVDFNQNIIKMFIWKNEMKRIIIIENFSFWNEGPLLESIEEFEAVFYI